MQKEDSDMSQRGRRGSYGNDEQVNKGPQRTNQGWLILITVHSLPRDILRRDMTWPGISATLEVGIKIACDGMSHVSRGE